MAKAGRGEIAQGPAGSGKAYWEAAGGFKINHYKSPGVFQSLTRPREKALG